MATFSLLILQPIAIIFTSQSAMAIEADASILENDETKNQSQEMSRTIQNMPEIEHLEKPVNGQPHNVLKPANFNFTWDAVSGIDEEQVSYNFRMAPSLTTESDLDPDTTHSFASVTNSFAFAETGMDGGKWYWQVQAVDSQGVSAWSDIWQVTVDATLPVTAISQPSGVYGGPTTSVIPFSATVYDAGGIKKCTIIQDDGTPIETSESSSLTASESEPVTHVTLTATIDAGSLSEGTHGITVKIEDIAGNEGVRSQSFVVDKTAPQLSVNINNNQTVKGVMNINLMVDDATLQTSSITLLNEDNTPATLEKTDTEQADVEVAAATNTLKWDTKKVANGMYRIRFFGKDAAGNESSLLRTVMVDNVVPAPGAGTVNPVDSDLVVDPLLDQLSKQLALPFPMPQPFDIAPPGFANVAEVMDERLVSSPRSSVPETDHGTQPIAIAPTENGWRILGVLWYWWFLPAIAMSVVIFKWRSIWQVTTLVLRK